MVSVCWYGSNDCCKYVIVSEVLNNICELIYVLMSSMVGTSAASAFFMSLERYRQIVLSRTFSKNRIIQTIIFIWLFFPFMASIPLMTGAVYEERPSQVWCLPAFTGHATENLPFMIMAHILLWTALIGIPFCYWNIYKFALHNGFKWGLRKGAITAVVGPSASSNTGHDTRNSQTLKTAGMDLSSQSVIVEEYSKADNALRSQLRLTKKMALLVLQFYIGWFGLAISFMFETFQNTRISPAGDFILGTSNVLSWVLNPIILLTLDNQLKIRFTLRHKS
ncbi:hypothetical protein BKA69DRAFT_713446 [Paraphysoderma sedebokerense]|nr:hypothetical protein BKA69DRAFT_713446 [Paraphysoderma sedebokerense]